MSDRVRRTIAASCLGACASLFGLQAWSQGDARVITFDDAIRIALEQNSALRQAQNTTALGELAVDDARAQFIPDLRVGTSVTQGWSNNSDTSEFFTTSGSTQSGSVGLNSGVTVFNGFANTATLASARLSRNASNSDLVRAQETVVFTVATNFLALVNRQEQLRVQRENLAAQVALEQQIQTYVTAGARTVADLYQQQANVASARLAVVEASRSAELAQIDLIRTLLLDPSGAYSFVPPIVGAVDASYTPAALDDLVRRAYDTRSDLDATEARLAAAEQDIRVARSSRWPTVGLNAGYNSSYSSLRDGGVSDQLDDRRGGSVGLNVSVPLFDRSATRIATRRAEIFADSARIDLETLQQEVGAQVRTALLDLRAAGEALLAAEAQQRAAERALEVTRQRYAVGAATLVELTQSQASQVEAASAFVSARYNVEFQRRLLDYYIGGLDAETVRFP